jgi:hypothetical protein
MVQAIPGNAAAAHFSHGFTAYLGSNFSEAFMVWLPLAEAGEIEAQFGLGLLYEQGQAVMRDLEEAASWYARAAEQGSMRAQTQLGGMYARGDGVAEDWSRAIAWWRRAAAQGSKRAKFHLGQAYQFGSGVERDIDMAIQWYSEAAALGFRAAALHIEQINRLRSAGDEAAQASLDPGPAPPDDEPSGIVLSLTGRDSVSVFYETSSDLKFNDSAPLIALGDSPPQPLEEAYRIYLASYRSIHEANEDWRGIADSNAALLDGLFAAVAQTDLGRDKGIVYRLQAGPLPDADDANALCYRLSQRDIPCAVVAP